LAPASFHGFTNCFFFLKRNRTQWFGGRRRYGALFRQKVTPEDAIGTHTCSLEADRRVANGISLGCPLSYLACKFRRNTEGRTGGLKVFTNSGIGAGSTDANGEEPWWALASVSPLDDIDEIGGEVESTNTKSWVVLLVVLTLLVMVVVVYLSKDKAMGSSTAADEDHPWGGDNIPTYSPANDARNAAAVPERCTQCHAKQKWCVCKNAPTGVRLSTMDMSPTRTNVSGGELLRAGGDGQLYSIPLELVTDHAEIGTSSV
jgi:hypothetical protein